MLCGSGGGHAAEMWAVDPGMWSNLPHEISCILCRANVRQTWL
jgi:hypothetical protein